MIMNCDKLFLCRTDIIIFHTYLGKRGSDDESFDESDRERLALGSDSDSDPGWKPSLEVLFRRSSFKILNFLIHIVLI